MVEKHPEGYRSNNNTHLLYKGQIFYFIFIKICNKHKYVSILTILRKSIVNFVSFLYFFSFFFGYVWSGKKVSNEWGKGNSVKLQFPPE